jgi:hypothetical protein
LPDVSTLDRHAGRNAAHDELVHHLYRAVRAAGHLAAVGCSTLTGKRPDLASINRAGELVLWEAKTRFEQHERQQAWTKYHRDCHWLFMVYPMGTDLFNWSPATWLPTPPSSRYCGAMLVDDKTFKFERAPQALMPEPTEVIHLTQSVLRLHGSTARKFSALE